MQKRKQKLANQLMNILHRRQNEPNFSDWSMAISPKFGLDFNEVGLLMLLIRSKAHHFRVYRAQLKNRQVLESNHRRSVDIIDIGQE